MTVTDRLSDTREISRAAYAQGHVQGPFDLADERAYRLWRAEKLDRHPRRAEDLVVEVGDVGCLTDAEADALFDRCRRANMAIYRCRSACADQIAVRVRLNALADRFGLRLREDHRSAEEDGLVALEVASQGGRAGFIPYTTRALNWHTDGYYNPPAAAIRAMVLHCVRPAAEGGINGLLDPEIAYIRLRDRDPRLVAALMAPDAMTIPAFREADGRLRAASVGPVFSVDPASGALAMRYTARTRSIAWRDNPATAAARAALTAILASEEPFLIRHRFGPGEGLLCNNVLHDRSAFRDRETPGEGRLYFRARYVTRIAGT